MSRNTNDLLTLLASLAGHSETQTKQDKAVQTMKDRGISLDNIRTFTLLHGQIPNLAETLATSVTLNHFTGNIPACTYGLATIEFMRGATQWMYDVLDKAHVAPSDFGMQDTPDSFLKFLGGKADEFNKTLAQHAEDEALIAHLRGGTAKEGPSRAACE